jgi:hypothetical protein
LEINLKIMFEILLNFIFHLLFLFPTFQKHQSSTKNGFLSVPLKIT